MDDERRADLAKQRALGVMRAPNLQGQRPGIFADSATAGLQRPLAGLSAGLSPWMHPNTTFGERFQGGEDAYTEGLNQQIAETNPVSALAQNMAGGLVMGGPEGSMWKQGAFDAGTAGTQGMASGDSWTDILASMAMNAGMGGLFNIGGKGVGKAREAEQRYMDTLTSAGIK